MITKVYVGELVNEDGDQPINTTSVEKVIRKLRELKDGDALVINCSEQDVDGRW